MPDANLIAYLTFTVILVVTPGSTTAVVVRNTLRGGRRAGLACATGAAAANSTHATLAGLGLTVLITRWPMALVVVRAIGAAYLGWLGAQSLWSALRFVDGGLSFAEVGQDFSPAKTEGTTKVVPFGAESHGFREGLVTNLVTPAIVSFYSAIVPSFMPPGAPGSYFALLAACHVGMALVCHSLWAIALDAVRRWFAPPAARRGLTAATGLALIFLAVRVLL